MSAHDPQAIAAAHGAVAALLNGPRYWLMNAGEEIYELVDPDGRRWVMQTYSQVADPGLSRADLPGRAERLDLPAGWTYRPRMLTSELRVDTRSRPARVLQDNLTNSYSMETD